MEIAQRYDRIATTYDRSYRGPVQLAENGYILKRLRGIISYSDKVLDVGCGTGLFVDLMPSVSSTGLDVSPKMVEVARYRHPTADFRVGNIETWRPREGERWTSAVSLFGPFSHVVDVDRGLENMTSMLYQNSQVLLMIYGCAHTGVSAFWDAGQPQPYRRSWRPEDAERVFGRHLRDVRVEPVFTGRGKSVRAQEWRARVMSRFPRLAHNAHHLIVTGRT